MKRAISIIISSVLFCGILFAADMTGEFNTWLGYIAGINADGNRTTVQGAGAGGDAVNLVRTDLIGAAAGAYSTNLTDCVGIGFRSLLYSSDMESVVAIGTDAFTNKTQLKKATWVNGQFAAFAQNNSFWFKANPATDDTNAPIHYANGVLSLNAETIRINGETTSGGLPGATQHILDGYDLYVDPVGGDDSFNGQTRYTPKRTIDAAYSLVTSNDVRICLLAGEHSSPTGRIAGGVTAEGSLADVYPEYRIHLIAPYGAKYTILDGGKTKGYWGCNYLISSIEGCTMRNFTTPGNHNPMFFAVHFYKCNIELDNYSPYLSDCGFFGCILEECTVNGTVAVGGSWQSASNAFFCRSDLFDSVIEIGITNVAGYSPYFLNGTYVENCYLSVDSASTFSGGTYSSVLGNPLAFADSTVICPQGGTFNVPSSVGCLFGLGDVTSSVPVYGATDGCVSTNAATITAVIQDDHRPPVTEWRYRFAGYGAAYDRTVKNSMENAIVNALLSNGTLSLSASSKVGLLNVVTQNEKVDEPREGNRDKTKVEATLEVPAEDE